MQFKHGMCSTRLYKIWSNMKMRCTNPHHNSYWKYGKRGIGFCSEWENFEPFELWALQNGYQDDLTLDRINGNLGYSPDNCRWATYREQANNMRSNRAITINGTTMNAMQWAEMVGIRPNTLYDRLARGWRAEDAVLIPPGSTRRYRMEATQAGEGGQ